MPDIQKCKCTSTRKRNNENCPRSEDRSEKREYKKTKTYKRFFQKTRPDIKVIRGNSLWNKILKEHVEEVKYHIGEESSPFPHGIDTEEWKYVKTELLPILLPALEHTLFLARTLKVETGKLRAFDYTDTLVHFMLNLNSDPSMPTRVEDIQEIKEYLKKHPRPPIPRHKLWSRHKAATFIQKNVRGWLVRKRPDVQELRQFWKTMRKELSTRKGWVIPPMACAEIRRRYQEKDYSSDTDSTLYNDSPMLSKNRPVVAEKRVVSKNLNPKSELMVEEARKLLKSCRVRRRSGEIKGAACRAEDDDLMELNALCEALDTSTTGTKSIESDSFVCNKPELTKEDAGDTSSVEGLTI